MVAGFDAPAWWMASTAYFVLTRCCSGRVLPEWRQNSGAVVVVGDMAVCACRVTWRRKDSIYLMTLDFGARRDLSQ